MANPMLAVEWGPCALEQRRDKALEAYVRRRMGTVPSCIPYFAPCPWLARAEADLNYPFGLLVHLDMTLADLVSMVVSQINSCRYCYAVSRMLLRMQGKSEAEVGRIEERLTEGWGDPRVEAAVSFARRIGRADPLPGEEDRRQLRAAGFSEDELRELAYVAAFTAFGNRAATLPAVPPDAMEGMPETLALKWFRPLVALWVGRYVRYGEPSDVEPADDMPYAYLGRVYRGMPIGTNLNRTLRDAWASPILTTRCKALLFAVVAKALDCTHSLAEARRLLGDQAMADADIDEVLAHLQSGALDPIESLLVPFARETVWYQPHQIQRRARQVGEALTAEQFLEAVGVLALANATCRLDAAIGAAP